MLPENDFWRTIVLTAMPAAGSLLGGLLAEVVGISRRTLSLALHSVAGILLGVVGVELMPVVLKSEQAWLMMLLFLAGGLFILGVGRATHFTQYLLSESQPASTEQEKAAARVSAAGQTAAWVIFIGVAIDFITDGLMIVTGAGVSPGLGILLGVALLAADTPEAFATIANMKRSGSARRTRLLISASFPLTLLLGAVLGEWLLRGSPQIVQFGILAFTAGIILTLVESEIIPQTFENWEGELATLILIGSFAAFALISTYVG